MLFDPIYWIVMGIGMLLSLGANAWVKARVRRWSEVTISNGMTGREVAQRILDAEGIKNVTIEQIPGSLSDHYDPSSRTLRLSDDIYSGQSITSAGIAAHEVGHALQDKQGYPAMQLRQRMVPVANIGTNLGIIALIIGIAVGISGIAIAGVILFSVFVLFTLITLPVEFDASARAKKALTQYGIITVEESEGVRQILTAAAATYVAAAATALLQLFYWVTRLGLGRR